MKNNLEKVIITGGAGFIGSNLAEHLFKNGTKEILIVDDFSTGSMKNIEHLKNTNIINGRIEDIEDLETRLMGYDFCFHLAAGVGVKYIMDNVSKALNTNIEATHKIFSVCSKLNIPILITSTSEVYGVSEDEIWTEETKSLLGPPTKLRWSYATSKLIDEFMALAEYNDGNLNPIIVRLFNIIGPNQSSEFGMVVPKFVEAAIDNNDITKAMTKLYEMGSSGRKELGKKAREYALTEFGYEKMINLWNDTLLKTIMEFKFNKKNYSITEL